MKSEFIIPSFDCPVAPDDFYSGTMVSDLIALCDSVPELQANIAKAAKPNRCQCLIVQNSEDQYGTLCLRSCTPGESYCDEHIDRRPWIAAAEGD